MGLVVMSDHDIRTRKQRGTTINWLFFGSQSRRRTRISAEDEMSFADKSLQKQQKQPDLSRDCPFCAS
jgi:hypothetical protein